VSLSYHTPVLAEEVVCLMDPKPGQTLVDATVGGGGHALLIGQRLAPNGTLVVIDQDASALEAATTTLQSLRLQVIPIQGNFRHLPALLDAVGVPIVHGIFLDLGVSSHQLDSAERGFSFRLDGPLDMRMNPAVGPPAQILVAQLDEQELTRILREYGQERWAARIAHFIVEQRKREPIQTTRQLAELVCAAIPQRAHPRNIHPATRTFQALRIAVNDELNALQEALDGGIPRLAPGGRIVVISYHSLEDRIVKQTFARFAGKCQCPPRWPICACGARQTIRILTRKPVVPSPEEISRNPRARSAKLRAAERVKDVS